MNFIVSDERDAIQKKTFTKWVNKHLKKVRNTKSVRFHSSQPPADVGAGVSPTTSVIFQVFVVSMEPGLKVEKASWESVNTLRYFPFQECLVTRYELAWSGQTENILREQVQLPNLFRFSSDKREKRHISPT